jgi:hypothetical protein
MIQRRMVEKWIDLAFMGRFPFPLCEKRKKGRVQFSKDM